MATVRFERGDAWLLWSIPGTGCDLTDLMRSYSFFARDSVPSFDGLAGCLSRAARVGALYVPPNGRYQLTPEWYARIHSQDDQYEAFEYGLIEFEDEFITQDWPALEGVDFVLDVGEYRRAAAGVQDHQDKVFGRQREKRWWEFWK